MGRLAALERAWERSLDRAPWRHRPPAHLRIVSYGGHGGPDGTVVRGRVVDDPPLSVAVAGEGVRAAVRRSVRSFLTRELPGVPLWVEVGGATVAATSDADGYVVARLAPPHLTAPWTPGTIRLAAPYRGRTGAAPAPVEVAVPGAEAAYGVVSDVDDTVLETGVQRVATMLRRTLTGSALTREAFPGSAALYRELAGSANPFFYVSSSPWNLHDLVVGFLRHQGFPAGPVLLRDLVGTAAGRETKHDRIREILALHPALDFVLLGDSGEEDTAVYAELAREHPGRIRAVLIREVRLDPRDERVERVPWPDDVPFVLAADSAALRRAAVDLGLLP